jgi:molecular chaperone DnaK
MENIVVTIHRAEYETECRPLLDRIEKVIEWVLFDLKTKLGGEGVEDMNIWLLGNASRMPAISRQLRTKYSVQPPSLSDLKASVALGAAKIAAMLSGLNKNFLLLDVTARSVGIQTSYDDFETIIPKDTTIPARAAKTFTTVSNNQTSINVPILEEAERTSERHRAIGTLKMENIPPRAAGEQNIEVVFEVDCNNILHVSATDKTIAAKRKTTWNILSKKKAKPPLLESKAVQVTCDGLELSRETLDRYHLFVQRWVQQRRERWSQVQG